MIRQLFYIGPQKSTAHKYCKIEHVLTKVNMLLGLLYNMPGLIGNGTLYICEMSEYK